jgi:transposase InsO family protein
VDRILDRHGEVTHRPSGTSGELRYERNASNELWQVDGKGVPRRCPYWPLSVLDDHSWFLLGLSALADKRIPTVLSMLWEVFGEYGLPEAILTDNGDGFNDWQAKGPTRFEAQLWLLGIRTLHGRCRHPQTQGKVERFHGTLETDLGDRLRPPTREEAEVTYEAYRREYNWERPHEAIGMKVPGAVYESSPRKRPKTKPVHELPGGAMARKVGFNGDIAFKGHTYLVGKGLRGEYVEIREEATGHAAYYASVRIATLQELKL